MSDLFVSDLNELTAPLGTDMMHVYRSSDSSDPDKRMLLDKLVLASGAQTIAGAKTLSALLTANAGVQFGATPKSTLNRFAQGQTWTPVITGSGSNPTITYGSQTGEYTWIGNVLFYRIVVTFGTPVSGGSGDVRVSLPQAVASSAPGVAVPQTVNLGSAEYISMSCNPTAGQSYAIIQAGVNGLSAQTLQCNQLAAFQIFSLGGFYFTS